MRRLSILIFSFFNFVVLTSPALGQDDDATAKATLQDADGDAHAPKFKRVTVPDCPTKEVRGICIDAATKAPLAGIMLMALDNVNFTAMTEDNGEFVIKVPVYTTALYVHSPQYISLQVAIVGEGSQRSDSGLKIEMLPDVFRPMFTKETSIIAANTHSITNTTSHSIESDIGDIMGTDVHTLNRSGNPGNGSAMFIRGLNSLNANAQPLIVIDGVIQDMQQTRTSLHDGDYTNLLLNINPEDIDKVTVLKNATALYGAKGSNGVILIETKRGHSMATRIDANVGVGVSLIPRLPTMMDASQYRIYASEMLGTYPTISQYTDPTTFKFLIDDPSKYYYAMYHNDTDWTKEVYHTAMNQNYNINVQGGDDIGMYNLSLGYTDGQSTAKENGFNRLNVRFNTDISILRQLKVRFDMSYTKINRDVFDGGAPADFSAAPVSSPTFLALIKSPFLNPYTYNNVSRYFSSTLSEADDYLTMLDTDLSLGNPTAVLQNGKGINKNRVESNHFNTVVAPRFDFNSWLSLTETFSYTLDRISQRYYRPNNGMPMFLIEGIGSVQNKAMSMFSKETSISSDTRLALTTHFSPHAPQHTLNAFVGFRYLNFAYDNNQPEGQYANAANDKTPNISTNMDFYDATGTNDQWRSMTWYVNADYNYRSRYYLQASLSMEGNSRFGKESKGVKIGGVKWGLFPSIQLGWAISNEAWFQKLFNSSNSQFLNYLLLRAGWDLSGNDDISNYAARTSFGISKYLWKATAAQLDNIGNEEISCERTSKFNFGLKASLFKNRIGIDFDYYIHRTNDLLTLKHFDNLVAGIDNYWSNGGSLSNTGFELALSAKPVVCKSLQIELGASIGHYVNKVKSLPDNSLIYLDGKQTAQGYTSSIYGTENIATIVGQPVGVFYGYKTNGVFATDQEASTAAAVPGASPSGSGGYLYLTDATGARQNFHAGDTRFVDINGDGEIGEADKTIIGDPNPDIYGNIFANVHWKNLTLYLGFNYSLGNDIYNYQRSVLEGGNNFYNQTTNMTNRWRTEGQQTDVPRISYGDPMGNSRFSDRWIENGSYLRLKTLRLTYKVPVSLSWLQGLALWGEANNLFTVTRYVGSDPEFSASNAVLYQGIDPGNVAMGRTFTFGMRINL